MLAQLAWKNIWRNKVRSLIVISSVMLGLWSGAFIMAYVFGMIETRLADAIENEISHIQLHHPEYGADNDPEFHINGSNLLVQEIKKDPAVKAASARVIVYGMINSPNTSAGGKLIGVDPEQEDSLTSISSSLVEGEYLKETDRNKLFIGRKLADKLKVKLRSKVVLTFQDTERNIVAGAFRIKGIYQSYNSSIEGVNIYLNEKDLDHLLGNGGNHQEIALYTTRVRSDGCLQRATCEN